MAGFENPNHFANARAFATGGRTDNDQSVGNVERSKCLVAQGMIRAKFVTFAKDKAQRFMDRSSSVAPYELVIGAEAFQPAVQPLRPARVGVAVNNERTVLDLQGHAYPRNQRLDSQ